jgi:hypothetical protein
VGSTVSSFAASTNARSAGERCARPGKYRKNPGTVGAWGFTPDARKANQAMVDLLRGRGRTGPTPRREPDMHVSFRSAGGERDG